LEAIAHAADPSKLTLEHAATLELPTFELKFAVDLLAPNQTVLSPAKNAVVSITPNVKNKPPLSIGAVSHAVYIQLDKDGVTAAAATVVSVMRCLSAPPPPNAREFVFNSPFLFAIVTPRLTPILMVSRHPPLRLTTAHS
jgi:serine protease inhibitor